MNILPKKRWHVRTKENIARVRKDEAAAREQESIKLKKLKYAESEVRINYLRDKSRVSTVTESQETANEPDTTNSHFDLFSDYKSHVKTTNKDLENEKKEEREKYEKQIGYLTYLGQDTNEALKTHSWYEVAPQRTSVGDKDIIEKDSKNKYSLDPLTLINSLLPSEKTDTPSRVKKIKASESPQTLPPKKHKKEKKHKRHKLKKLKSKKEKLIKKEIKLFAEQQTKKETMEKLRKERLKREAKERARQEELLNPKVTQTLENSVTNNFKTSSTIRIIQKYNCQFNPELAKQNMN